MESYNPAASLLRSCASLRQRQRRHRKGSRKLRVSFGPASLPTPSQPPRAAPHAASKQFRSRPVRREIRVLLLAHQFSQKILSSHPPGTLLSLPSHTTEHPVS